MKVAIYNRGKQLAVREQPEPGAPVVGTLADGTAVEVEGAAPGWLKCRAGYIREDLVAVGVLEGFDAEEQPEDDERPQEQQEASAEDEVPGDAVEQPEDDEDAALKAMKLNDLRELAKGSGISLPKNATKAQIIGLLTGSDEQA